MLGPVEGVNVLDLFAGTGALGIEALSRGAAAAVFVERDGDALAALNANLAALGLQQAEGPQVQVRSRDALAAMADARARGETYDLVFLDPPYAQAHALGPRLAQDLPSLLAPGGTRRGRERPARAA